MSYWSDRQEEVKKLAEKNEAKFRARVSKYCEKEWARLEKEIASYYAQYGTDNVVEYRTLLQDLSEADKSLLMERMDDFAKKYPEYAHLIPVRESIYKLDRLEGLQYSLSLYEANIAGYVNGIMKPYLDSLTIKSLNAGMRVMGFGKNFYKINDAIIEQFVDVPWCNGENYSTRIWNDTQRLANTLNQELAQSFARGERYQDIARRLQKKFNQRNVYNTYRLVYTEGTYIMNEAGFRPFADDFDRYLYLAIMDGKTCPICRDLNGKKFVWDERQTGINFPPIHPWCRCSATTPTVDDWDAWIDDYVAKHGGDRSAAKQIAERIR